MAFDPKKFLARTAEPEAAAPTEGGGFDPKKFLERTTPTFDGKAERAAEDKALSDEMGISGRLLAGAGAGALNAFRNIKDLSLATAPLPDDIKAAERAKSAPAWAAEKEDAEKLGTAGKVGQVLGEIGATAPLGAVAGGLARGATAAKAIPGVIRSLAPVVAEGMAQGGVLAGPGERLLGTVLGGAGGIAGKLVGAGAKALGGKVAEGIRGFAEKRAVKALGPTLADVKALSGKAGGLNQLGRTLLDEGVVTTGSLDDIAANAASLKGKAGQEIGGVLKELDALQAAQEALRPKPGRLALPANAGDGVGEALGSGAGLARRGGIVPGSSGAAPGGTGAAPLTEAAGQTARFNVSRAADRIEKELIDAVRGSPAHQSMLPELERKLVDLRKFGNGGDLTFEAANALKGSYDDFIKNWDKLGSPAQEGLKRFRGILNSEIEDRAAEAAEQAGSDVFTRFKGAKKLYGQMADASDIAKDQLARREANRFLSPTDYFSGATGLMASIASGHPAPAIAGAGLALANKAIRRRGNQVAAVGLDKLSNVLPAASKAVSGAAEKLLPTGARGVAGQLGGEAATTRALPHISEIARKDPQALGPYAAYFPPNASDEEHAVADYTLAQTDPGYQRHRRELALRMEGER